MALGRLSRSSRTAPSTARSASRLCGGILEVSRSLSVATSRRPRGALDTPRALSVREPPGPALLSADGHLELRGDVGVQADGHAELSERLDGLVEPDAPALDVDAVLGEEHGDVVPTHRAEEPVLVGSLPGHEEVEPLDGLR